MVIDLGFGDAGKGRTVDWLCARRPESSLVIRYGGGHQVGHTVSIGGLVHVFSNFGAGSLRGVPTWFGRDCTVFPPAIAAEQAALTALLPPGSPSPELAIHPLAKVCTPWDIAWNRAAEAELGHGSCGVGFGATVERHAAGVPLYAKDLAFDWVARQKLQGIRYWYGQRAAAWSASGDDFAGCFAAECDSLDLDAYLAQCRAAAACYRLAGLEECLAGKDHLVFEGHQGLMLDQHHGIYPHVTWSSTGSAPALALLAGLADSGGGANQAGSAWRVCPVDLYCVTRCYQTRHGRGPMSSSQPVALVAADAETNRDNGFQGAFRSAELDPELLAYALVSDRAERADLPVKFAVRENLVVTCLDQRPGFRLAELVRRLDWPPDRVYYSPSADSAALRAFCGNNLDLETL
ncbi:MAG: hypothetical protein A2Y32_05670 [Spirochaetes bacterium GWF1_60_12]|nr:MAG: hypothetical protein A2Y32_05670 [Spirochaetes bacterium GWF1_60_12]